MVAPMPSHSMNRARAGASRSLRASCSRTSDAARMKPSTLSGEQSVRRAVLAVCPAQAVDVGVADHRREGGHGADHGRRREANHPVPGHRLALRRVLEVALLGVVRGRISELSLKQHG
jgi:hypothetical protein